MDEALHAFRNSWLGVAMRETPNLFPAMEMTHFIGLSLLMGAMILVDLRILGMWKSLSYSAAFKLLPVAIVGFSLNLISGVCFIAANPGLYFTNPAFFVKLVVIALGGLNALWFTFAEHKQLAGLPSEAPAPGLAKAMAAASLVMWVAVILLGRLLPTFAPVAGG